MIMKSTSGMTTRPITIKRKFQGKPIANTRRVERVLKLIKFLSGWRTIREIKLHLDIHEKSVQRYLNLLVQLGFDVEVIVSKYNNYRISNINKFFKVSE